MYKKLRKYYAAGGSFLQNPRTIKSEKLIALEIQKRPLRFNLINWLLSKSTSENTEYLEIGVRNPADNFNKINAFRKISVDPGIEFESNPVDFQLTSDEFFKRHLNNEFEGCPATFDVIFIDGLHTAEQVYKDIKSALCIIKKDGYIVLHDCNPPNEFFAREDYYFDLTPAKKYWNGTTWKAFYRARIELPIKGYCIDSDWGLGVIKKSESKASSKNLNPFYEYSVFNENREEHLNLMDFDQLKSILSE